MGVIEFILLTLFLGVVVFFVWKTPIHMAFKQLVLWVAIIVLVILLLKATGIIGHDIAIPRLR